MINTFFNRLLFYLENIFLNTRSYASFCFFQVQERITQLEILYAFGYVVLLSELIF
jgi:hypothetical protein